MNRWAVIAITGSLAHAAAAHHSTSMYAKDAPITIEAEVVEFRWVNPHSQLTVVDTHDASRKWSIEMSSPGVLTRSGWTKRTFNPGDKIKLKFGPLRNGDAGGYFLEATLADGKVMTYSVELPTE
ncbi:MAG TPA: DUF6152 family protein [Gammaproteobacteria bacterium]